MSKTKGIFSAVRAVEQGQLDTPGLKHAGFISLTVPGQHDNLRLASFWSLAAVA